MRNVTEVKKSESVSFENAEAPYPRFERWMNYPSTPDQVNLPQLRILGLLFDEDQTRGWGYTKSQIVAMLKIWEDQADNLLNQLQSQELLYCEQIPFGMDLFGIQRKVRVYHITEIGRFYINQLDTQFPGVWVTRKGKWTKPAQIHQVALYQKNGDCIFNLDYSNIGFNEQLFRNLLLVIDSFSQECLELKLCELVIEKYRVFLSRIASLIIVVVTEGSSRTYLELRPQVLSLMERFGMVLSLDEFWGSQSNIGHDSDMVEWMRERVEEEIRHTFSID